MLCFLPATYKCTIQYAAQFKAPLSHSIVTLSLHINRVLFQTYRQTDSLSHPHLMTNENLAPTTKSQQKQSLFHKVKV